MPIKGRDVRQQLGKNKVDPRIQVILESMAEEQYEHHKAISEIANMLDQLATIVMANVEMSENIKHNIGRLAKNKDIVRSEHIEDLPE